MSGAIVAGAEDRGCDASPLSLGCPDHMGSRLPSSSSSDSSRHFPSGLAREHKAAETPNATFFSWRSMPERSALDGPGNDPIIGSQASGDDRIRIEGTIKRPGHLYWRWGEDENRAGRGLSGERRPERRWRRLCDSYWFAAKAAEFARRGPTSAGQAGPSAGRSRPGKQERRLAARRFFYPRPVGLNPTLDRRLVPFDGAALGFLRRPAQAAQDAPDMVDMIANAKPLLDDLGYTRTCPQVCRIADSPGPSKQKPLEGLPCRLIQFGWPSGQRLGPNRFRAALQKSGFPPPDAPSVNTHAPGDFHRLQSLLKKRDGAPAPSFQELWTSGWPHGYPPAQIIGHLLCRSQ